MNFFKTYQVSRTSADQLIVVAHVGYVFLIIAFLCFGFAMRNAYQAQKAGQKSLSKVPLVFMGIFFVLFSVPHGRMVFDKGNGTFTADRTHWYGITDHTEAPLGDVVAARLNQANTTYQLYVVLKHSDKPVVIYALDSAVGQDEAAKAIDRFLEEYTPPHEKTGSTDRTEPYGGPSR